MCSMFDVRCPRCPMSARKFLEKKVEGPSILKLWPGLYFDSDPVNKNDGPNKKVAGKNEAVRIEVNTNILIFLQ